MTKPLQHGLLLGICGTVLAMALAAGGLLSRWENLTWDARARWLARPVETTDSIRLIMLDQTSLDWAADHLSLPWPWPREVYAAIMDFCRRADAHAVVFDVMFTEPSAYGVSDDAVLGDAIERGPPFVGAVFLSRETGAHSTVPDDVRMVAITGRDISQPATLPPWATAAGYPWATFPIPEIRSSATLLGNVSSQPDADGIFRRLPPLGVFDGHPVPTLGLAPWLAQNPDTVLRLETRNVFWGDRAIPVDRQGRAILRYRGPSQTHPTVNAAAIINSELQLREGLTPQVDPQTFKDTWVFFGFTAPGLFDLKAAPVSPVYPGMEIHATLLDNLLAGDFIRPLPIIFAFLITGFLAVAGGITARRCGSAMRGGVMLAISLGLPISLGISAYTLGYDFPVATLQTAMIISVAGGLLVNYAIEGSQRRFLKSAFKQYLSQEFIDQLVAHPERLQLGGEERELTLFFSDIRGFTTLSESLAPIDLTAVLNDYLTAMCDVIMQTGGTIDKFEGDAVIAFWNAPLTQPDHAARAIDAALRCQERLAELRPDFEQRTGQSLFTRIGLHTGPVVVGNLGSNQRFNYTFLGDAGNLASRIEGVNKVFGTRILVTAQTADKSGGKFPVREIAVIRVVGRAAPVTIFEPVAATPSTLDRKDLDRFGEALQLWKQGQIDEAASVFSTLADRDPVAAAYVERCTLVSSKPLPPDWDGVWNLTEK